jgi:hypothetical protein
MKDLLIFVLAAICFCVSIVLMPWSELGFTGDFPTWLAWAMGPLGVTAFFQQLPWGPHITQFLTEQGAKKNFGDYAYVLFMCAAMCAAAIAIVLIGKEEAEEKTILPIKK